MRRSYNGSVREVLFSVNSHRQTTTVGFECDFRVLLLRRCLIVGPTAGERCYTACLLKPACGVCTCMNHCNVQCDRTSVLLHVNVSGLPQNTIPFVFEYVVLCFADDELIGAVACTLSSVPPGLP